MHSLTSIDDWLTVIWAHALQQAHWSLRLSLLQPLALQLPQLLWSDAATLRMEHHALQRMPRKSEAVAVAPECLSVQAWEQNHAAHSARCSSVAAQQAA